MIICLACGASNQPGASHCASCGAVVPKMDYSVTNSGYTGRLTGRFEKFQDACRRVRAGEWSKEEFGAWLENIQKALNEKAGYLVNLIHESGYYEHNMDEVEHCFTGIENYEKGMNEMWQYIEDGDMANLDRGLEIMWEGNELINEAMRMNREFRRGLEEEWGYM